MTFLGFYGCSGRLVRVGHSGPGVKTTVGRNQAKRPKPTHKIDCPACDKRHTVSIWWRRPGAHEMNNTEVMV